MDQLEFLKIVADKLERAGLRFMVVGSYASGYWGEPRSTYDLDVLDIWQAILQRVGMA